MKSRIKRKDLGFVVVVAVVIVVGHRQRWGLLDQERR